MLHANQEADGAEGARIVPFTGSVSGAAETWAGDYSVETDPDRGRRRYHVPAAKRVVKKLTSRLLW